MYDIDTGKHLKKIFPDIKDPDLLMTAMTPALDTVWVGMASGHIMMFHKDELLAWFHPYDGYVRFLTCIQSSGPCEMEKGIVVSGGKVFRSLIKGFDQKIMEGNEASMSGTIIMWEAYEAKTMRQVKQLEEKSPSFLDSHHTVCQTIHQDHFRDGTNIKMTPPADSDATSFDFDHNVADTMAQHLELNQSVRDSLTVLNPSLKTDSRNTAPHIVDCDRILATSQHSIFTDVEKSASPTMTPEIQHVCTQSINTAEETFTVELPGSEQTKLVRCNKPVKLQALLSEIQTLSILSLDECSLEYYRDGKSRKLQIEEQLEEYLRLPRRPQLCVIVAKCDNIKSTTN
jgi:hypothetical protein